LLEAVEVLQNVEGLAIRSLSRKDVVRHPLVQKIINAYELHREAAPEA
jgi:phosphate starvation-inducible PhoH-like protein